MSDRARGTAVVVAPLFPLPPVSGGSKRCLRLVEAMQRAGAHVHVLTHAPVGAAELAEGRRRDWTVEVFVRDPVSLRAKLALRTSHRLPIPSAALLRRVEALAADARTAYVQYEEHHAAPYISGRPAIPTAFSPYNVDSAVAAQLAAGVTGRRAHEWRRLAVLRAASERRASELTDVTFCVSRADADHFATLGARAVEVPNGVDDALFDVPPPGDEPAIAFFGQLAYAPNREGLDRFLREGWPAVRAALPRARFRVAGPGSADLVLDALGPSAAGVELLGVVDDVGALLASVQVVACPVWCGGGTRLKVLEALAAARPVVGTGRAVEQIGFVAGRHGLVAETPEGLAAAAVDLLRDPARTRAMGLDGRRLAEGFRWEDVLRPAERIYAQWLSATA